VQYVLGLRADVPSGTLTWDVRQLDRHGVRAYPFGNGVVDLEVEARKAPADEPVVRVTSTVPLRLRVIWGCTSTAVGGAPPPDRIAAAARRRERVVEATVMPAILPVLPAVSPVAAAASATVASPVLAASVDLVARLPPGALQGIDVTHEGPLTATTVGRWMACDGGVISPLMPRAILELDAAPPAGGYRLELFAEPLDEPNALVLPLALGSVRFVAVLGLQAGHTFLSGLEAVNGHDVGNSSNPTRVAGPAPFAVGRRTRVVVDVGAEAISVSIDGENLISWDGGLGALDMQWWWQTPRPCIAVGALNCRFRITDVLLCAAGAPSG